MAKTLNLSNISNIIKSFMNNITINGESFVCKGKNIISVNGKIIVDGEVIKEGLSENVTIHFNGDLASLSCADAVINGNVHGDVNAADVRCNNVQGKITAASVKIKKNSGDIKM